MSPQRKRPATTDRPIRRHRANGYHESSGDYRFQTLTADERREQQLLEELQALGYGITMPCSVCGHPLSSARSLARHVGPRCAAKATVTK